MKRLLLPLTFALLLPACVQDDPISPTDDEAQMARVVTPVYRAAWYTDVDRKGNYLYPTAWDVGGWTWETANALAQSMRYKGKYGHLADFDTYPEEQAAVVTQLNMTPSSTNCWIGLVQLPGQTLMDAGWQWYRTGTAVAYQNWIDNNDGGGVEDGTENNAVSRVVYGGSATILLARWSDVAATSIQPCLIIEF